MTIQNNDLDDYISGYNRSMDDYQLEHFVVKSQVTKFRQLQQALIEYRSRSESIDNASYELDKANVHLKICERDIEKEDDDLAVELLLLEKRKLEKQIAIHSKTLALATREKEFFRSQLTDGFESVEELKAYIEDPNNEKIYWISRMAKQAAMDIVCLGRVGVGNMDSIAMMEEEDQMKTMEVAVQYSGLLNLSMKKLQESVTPHLQALDQSDIKCFPSFDGIEKDLNIKIIGNISKPHEKKNLQSSDQPESGN